MVTAFAFVDDVDIVQQIHSTIDPCKEVQATLDNWASGLHSTGGALVRKKSQWYLLIHYWKDDQWKLLSKSQAPGSLQTIGVDGKMEQLK
jgi:hypothetical protein